MARVRDQTTLDMYRFASQELSKSFDYQVRQKNLGLAILTLNLKWVLSYEKVVQARLGSVITEPSGSDENFSAQLVAEVYVYDPNNPNRGYGAAHIRYGAPHTPNPSRNDTAIMLRPIKMGLPDLVREAVEEFRDKEEKRNYNLERARRLVPTPSVNYAKNGASAESWDFAELRRLAKAISKDAFDRFGRRKLYIGDLVHAAVSYDNLRYASAEVPPNRLRRFDGSGRLLRRIMHIKDSIASSYVHIQMRTKPKSGIRGKSQRFRVPIPLWNPDYVNIGHMKQYFGPFLDKLEEFINAKSLTPGNYPVVLSPDATAVLIHEALASHVISGEHLMDEECSVLPQLGDPLFPLLSVDIYDDATIPGYFGSYAFDAEAVPGQRTQIVRDGKLENLLSDRTSAAFLNEKSTGNSRVQNYCSMDEEEVVVKENMSEKVPRTPGVRMSNTITEPRDPKTIRSLHTMARREAARSRLKHYLEIDSIHSAEVDVDKGTVIGYNVLGHKVHVSSSKREPFRGVNLVDDAHNIMSSLVAMGGESEEKHGHCGGHSGEIPITEKAPYSFSTGLGFKGLLPKGNDDESERVERVS